MRVVIVSTYPPIECGIGTYTDFLAKNLSITPNEIFIISQYGAKGDNVFGAYDSKDSDIAPKIFNIINKLTPDIVHIQHEFGLYGELHGIAVIDLIFRIKSTGIPVIATFHTVNSLFEFRRKIVFSTMCRELDGIIVHQQEHVEILKHNYKIASNKIFLIPHGAREITPIIDAKQKLGLTNDKVILLAGYFRESKCFDKIVDIFPQVSKRVPRAKLVLSGKLRVLEKSSYKEQLIERINSSPVSDKIEVFQGQFPQHTFDTIISAADIMIFPYTTGAQSGVLAHALSFGKPIVTSELDAFVDVIDKSVAGLVASTDDEYVEAICELLTNDTLYKDCSLNATNYVKNHISWEIIARITTTVYSHFEYKGICQIRNIYIPESYSETVIEDALPKLVLEKPMKICDDEGSLQNEAL